jgi:hypothetical protein
MKAGLAVPVDFISLNAFCASYKILWLFTNDIKLLYIKFSKILEKTDKMDIGV